MKTANIKSYIMIITAMLIWGSIGIFRRHIPVPSEFLAFIRGLLGSIFIFSIIIYHRNRAYKNTSLKSMGLLAFSGAMIGFNWIFLFEAINYTTVSVATLCYYMEPTVVMLLSPIFFKEKLTVPKLIIVALTALGMIMISGILDGFILDERQLTGIAFGLSAAFLYALIVITNKKIEQVDTYLKTFIQLSGAAIVMLPYLFITDGFVSIPDDGSTLIYILIVGIVHTGIAYALYFEGMKNIPAQSVAICSYIDPVSALFLAALLLGEILTPIGILGAILIIGSAMVSEINKW